MRFTNRSIATARASSRVPSPTLHVGLALGKIGALVRPFGITSRRHDFNLQFAVASFERRPTHVTSRMQRLHCRTSHIGVPAVAKIARTSIHELSKHPSTSSLTGGMTRTLVPITRISWSL